MKRLHFLKGDKSWVLADQVLVSGGSFGSNVLLARTLGITGFGRFSGVMMAQLFLLSVTLAVTSQVFQVIYPSQGSDGRRKLTAGMLFQQLFLGILVISALTVLCPVVFPGGLAWLGESGWAPLGCALVLALSVIQDFLRRVLLTQARPQAAFWIDLLENGLLMAGLFAARWMHCLTLSLAWWVIAGACLPSVVAGIVAARPGRMGRDAWRFAWTFQRKKGGWLIGSSLLQWGSGYFFVLGAGWWVSAPALGALRLVQYLFGTLNLLLQAIENYALPRAVAKGASAQAYWKHLLRRCLLLIAPVLGALSILARPLLRLSGGPAYEPYAFVVYGLSLVYVLVTIGYPIRIAIRSLHLDRHYFIAYILSVVVSMAAAPWLLRHWQLYGVLTGLFLSQAINIGYWLFILQRKHQALWPSYT